MSGAAGSGKSLSSKMVVQAFEDAGYKVIGASVSWKATRNFEAEAGAKSQSVASLVQSIKNGKSPLDAKTVLCIDEHGMCGSADTSIILKEAERAGAKVILIGESSQLVPISEGSAFASIENALKANGSIPMNGLADQDRIAVLDDIQRQRQAWHRDADYAMRAGDAAGADINAQDDDGLTALFYEGDRHDEEMIRFLLDAGADPTICDNDGCTAGDLFPFIDELVAEKKAKDEAANLAKKQNITLGNPRSSRGGGTVL